MGMQKDFFNTGRKWCCFISIYFTFSHFGVAGLSKPVLHLNKGVVNEGEELTARCTAPGETGSIFFYFYEGSKDILEKQVNSNQAEAKLRFSSVGIHKIHCAYVVLITPDSLRSEDSNAITVSVKGTSILNISVLFKTSYRSQGFFFLDFVSLELPIAPVLEIVPQDEIYEGDQLAITCTINNVSHSPASVHLYLSQGTQLLSSGDSKVNHSMVALAKDPGEFECKLEMGNVVKVATKSVAVTGELTEERPVFAH